MVKWRFVRSALDDPTLGFSLLRIYLGLALFVRGAMFIAEPQVLLGYLHTTDHWFVPLAASHYVAAAHLCGGILLALGLGTRVAAGLQLPALLGAVFLVHAPEGLLQQGQSLELSALVLCMLLSFTVFGGGKLSLDGLLEQRLAADPDSEREAPAPAPAPVPRLPV